MKRRLLGLLALLVAAVMIAGCGGGSSGVAPGDGGASGGSAEQGSGSADDFPSSTITLIVNYGAGGGTDLASRALASVMERELGVPVAVLNKAGGSATIGVTEIKNAAPDGYTFGVCSYAPMVIVPHQLEVTYTPEDFYYLGTISQYDYGILVRGDSDYHTVDDLVDAALASGGMNMMAAGYPHPIVIEGLASATGADFQWVNVESSAEAITSLLGSHCEAISLAMSDGVSYLESGELRLIASSTDARFPYAQDVPTLQEEGYDIMIKSFMGFGLPQGVPENRLNILQAAFEKALEDETFIQTMENLNMHTNNISGDEFYQLIKEDYDFYGQYFQDHE